MSTAEASVSERYIKYRKDELNEIKDLYESVMMVASHGLFFRTGRIIGKRIARLARGEEAYFEAVANVMKSEGWVEAIRFEDQRIIAKACIEVSEEKSDKCTCHMLRGILAMIYEFDRGGRVYCHELECESTENDKCVFQIDSEVV